MLSGWDPKTQDLSGLQGSPANFLIKAFMIFYPVCQPKAVQSCPKDASRILPVQIRQGTAVSSGQLGLAWGQACWQWHLSFSITTDMVSAKAVHMNVLKVLLADISMERQTIWLHCLLAYSLLHHTNSRRDKKLVSNSKKIILPAENFFQTLRMCQPHTFSIHTKQRL